MPSKALFVVFVGLTVISGVADAQGFIHAAHMWKGGRLSVPELGKSALGFGTGIAVYWLALRFLDSVDAVSPIVQAMLWFAITIVGVAITSGDFFHWPIRDRAVAVSIVLGLGWLFAHAAG